LPARPRQVLIAFDKFKGALDAEHACEVAARVIARRRPEWRIDIAPLSDGGDGFCQILSRTNGARLEWVSAPGPIFDPSKPREHISAPIGWVEWSRVPRAARELLALPEPEPTRLAVLDLASVNGLALVPAEQRDVWHASTYGTGALLAAAAAKGADAILLGVGGSATSDLGLGALAALGSSFEDAEGRVVHPPLPAFWSRVVRVRGSIAALPPLRIACDVQNPLLGPDGAAAVYGLQKGLAPGDLDRFDAAAARMAELLCATLGVDLELTSARGAGAAGGIAFGLMAGAGARPVPGFELVSRWYDLDARLQAADLLITGEGRFDASSWAGKGPGALLARATELRRSAVAFAGSVASAALRPGLPVIAISPTDQPLAHALEQTASHLERAIELWLENEP
jgi:glycerate kinase